MPRVVYEVIVMLLLVAVPLAGCVMFGGVRVWSGGILMFLVAVAGVLFAVRPLFCPELRSVKWPVGGIPLLLFLAYAAGRVWWAPVWYDAVFDVMRIASYVVAYWVWTGIGDRGGRWRIVLGIVIVAVTLLCWYALILHVRGACDVLMMQRPEQYGMRASATYMCPNHFANLLEIAGPLCMALLLSSAANGWLRILAIYGFVMCLPAVFLTQSRSGWVALFGGTTVTILLLAWRKSRRRFCMLLIVMPILAAALAGGLWAVSPVARERLQGAMLSSPDGAVQIRFVIWNDSLQMIREAPLFGHGGAVFRWIYPHYKTHDEQLWARYAHNEYLQVLTEYGSVGLALLLLAGGFVLFQAVRMALFSKRERTAALGSALCGALTGCLLHAVFDFNFHIFANVQLLVLLAGLAFSARDDGRQLASQSATTAGWPLVYGALVAGCLLLGVGSVRYVMSYHYMLKGDRLSLLLKNEQSAAAYRRAIDWMPLYGAPHIGLATLTKGRTFWERNQQKKAQLAAAALEEYDKALQLNPYDFQIQFGRSSVYGALNEHEQSMAALQQVLDFAPTEVFFLNHLGIRMRLAGRFDEARRLFERSLQLKSTPVAELNLRLLE